MAYANVPCWIREILGHLKTQEMCNKAVYMERHSLGFVPDHFKTQGMCNETVREDPYTLRYVPDRFIAQEMYDEAVHIKPHSSALSITILRQEGCATRQCIGNHFYCCMSLIMLRRKGCVKDLLKKNHAI